MKNLGNGKKRLKKLSYIGRTTKFKRTIALMLAAGVVCSAGFFGKVVYSEYAAARANVVLTFPQIAQSEYPDESRFTYYDFISDDKLAEALEIMRKDGKYLHYSVDDLREKFYIYSMMESSASSAVSSQRSEGNDYSYVSNEYKITFIQPHAYRSGNLFEMLFGKDYSEEFLNVLLDVNRQTIAEHMGGTKSFEKLTEVDDTDIYDYSEKLNVYRTKINTIRSYLKSLISNDPDFVYEDENLTLSDVESKYEFLITNSLDGISDFVESSGISDDLEQMTNKLNVNIENNTLKFNKQWDRSGNNQYAIKNYDQTFTENLINVIQNKEYGLYQARPKTAFDTVVVQKHDADESVARYAVQITKYKTELSIYNEVEQTEKEHARLVEKYERLMAGFEEEYKELSDVARRVVKEYYNDKNETYIEAVVKPRNVITKSLIMKMGIVFMIACMFMFVVMTLALALQDHRELKKKEKMIEIIKKNQTELGE